MIYHCQYHHHITVYFIIITVAVTTVTISVIIIYLSSLYSLLTIHYCYGQRTKGIIST